MEDMHDEIQIGPLFFHTNERKTELYVDNEHETRGMCEIYPHEWDEFVKVMRKLNER